jgi:hypothetical protein
MLVCEEFDAGSFAWRYSRCALSEPALPANSYWPLMGQHQAPPATPKPSEHLGAYGHSSCQRIIPLVCVPPLPMSPPFRIHLAYMSVRLQLPTFRT